MHYNKHMQAFVWPVWCISSITLYKESRGQFNCCTNVTVADCAGRPSRTQDLSLRRRDLSFGRRVRYQFAKEVTSLARPVHVYTACSKSSCYIFPCEISVCPRTLGTVSTVRVLTTTQLLYNIESSHREDSHSFFHSSLWTGNCHSHQGAFANLLALIHDYSTAPVQMVLPSCDHYSIHVQTLLPSGGPNSGAIVKVADCAGRPSRTRDLSLGRRVCYQFTKEITSLARPVHTLPVQCHSATQMYHSWLKVSLITCKEHSIRSNCSPPAAVEMYINNNTHLLVWGLL